VQRRPRIGAGEHQSGEPDLLFGRLQSTCSLTASTEHFATECLYLAWTLVAYCLNRIDKTQATDSTLSCSDSYKTPDNVPAS